MESVLGLDAQLSNDIAAIRNVEPIGSIADLRAKLPEGAFERLEPKILAAAFGEAQDRAVLAEQLAALTPPTGAITGETAAFTGDQMAAFDDEERRERPTGSYSNGDVGTLPSTGSGMPLLGLIGGISLMVSLSLRVLGRGNKAM
jgi:LPXTG-motif cell wall-anchored protein